MKTFNLPDLGEGLIDAELVAWHVGEGDHVVADQPLASVETEKAVVEVPSPRAGRIERLCAKPGERVRVGRPLVEFEEGAHPDEGTVVGHLPEQKELRPPKPAAVAASPAVRELAKRLGVDLARVHGTGPGGAVSAADVEKVAQAGAEPAAPAVGGERLSPARRAMAENMARAHAAVVPASVSDDADVDSWPADAPVTIRLIRAVVAGCAASPALNAWYDGRAQTIRLHKQVDLGIAVDSEAGLFVPVLRDCGRLGAERLRAEWARLKDGVARRSLAVSELRGATVTLSNFGSIVGRYGQLVIVPPQVAILGAGRIVPRAVAADGKPAVRRLLPLSLTFDHRAVTGGEAARFLAAIIKDLERPD